MPIPPTPKRSRSRRGRGAGRWAQSAALGAASLGAATGCFTSDDGLAPPKASFYYPTGLSVSPGGTALFVANSDFDLQYSGGTVQALDLVALRGELATVRRALGDSGGSASACGGLGPNTQRILVPGPCGPLDAASKITRWATIGAFASGSLLAHRPDGEAGAAARLFVPVRGDPSVTFFEITDDRVDPPVVPAGCGQTVCLECGVQGSERRCGPEHRVGEDPTDNPRGLVLPVEPVGIAATEDGKALVVAHQTTNQASLLFNDWAGQPTLEYFLGNLPAGPAEVAAVPEPRFAQQARVANPSFDYQPSFLMTYRAAAEVDVLRFHADEGSSPRRPFLTRVFAEPIQTNSSGADSRGIAVDPSARRACEAGCDPADVACLRSCADIPIRVFVANRAPATLLLGELATEITETEVGGVKTATGAFDTLHIYDSVALATGPSKVVLGEVIDSSGERKLRVFAVAFDSRLVFSYDPEARRVESIIRTGRGPHAIAFDVADDHAYMYVGHFTDSYVGVVDLDMRNSVTFGEMFASVGAPLPPQEAQ